MYVVVPIVYHNGSFWQMEPNKFHACVGIDTDNVCMDIHSMQSSVRILYRNYVVFVRKSGHTDIYYDKVSG